MDEHNMQTECRKIIDGYGKRVNDLQIEQAETRVIAVRNAKDVQDMFRIAGEIQKSVEKSKWQIFAIVSIPVILMIIQSIYKAFEAVPK